MFCRNNTGSYTPVIEGVEIKTLTYGDNTLLAKFRLAKGSVLPMHAHIYEQTGYLISGRMRFTIGDDTFDANQGDSWCIPGNVEHGVDVLEDSIVIEVFSPVRPDYLPENLG